MPGLTVKEKQHWRDRLAERIERRIGLIQSEQPDLFEAARQEAERRTAEMMGLAELQQERDALRDQQTELEAREELLTRSILARVRGVPLHKIPATPHIYQADREIEQAMQRRQGTLEEEILLSSERGRLVAGLRREKEGLLDSIWLATSPAQIKSLWLKVAELLGDDSTRLQQDALTLPPVEE